MVESLATTQSRSPSASTRPHPPARAPGRVASPPGLMTASKDGRIQVRCSGYEPLLVEERSELDRHTLTKKLRA